MPRVHAVHHEGEQLEGLRLTRRCRERHEGLPVANAEVLPAGRSEGVLRILHTEIQ